MSLPAYRVERSRCSDRLHGDHSTIALAVSIRVLTVTLNIYTCHVMSTMTRIKKMVSLALDPALLQRLDLWIKSQEIPPTKTAVMEAALRRFLDAEEKRGRR